MSDERLFETGIPAAASSDNEVAATVGVKPSGLRIGVDALRFVPCTDGRHETLLRGALRAMASEYAESAFVVFANREGRGVLSEDLGGFANVTLVALPVDGSEPLLREKQTRRLLPKVLRKQRCDVLWEPYGEMPKGLSCPVVVSLADLWPSRDPEPDSWRWRWLRRGVRERTFRDAACLTTLSEFSRQSLLHTEHVRFDRTAVLPVAVDDTIGVAVPPDELTDRMLALLRGADPFFLAVSGSHANAGLVTLVEAYGKVCGELPHRLVVVGRPGQVEEAFRIAVAGLPDPRSVVRLEYVSQADLVVLLQLAAAFVEPADHEGAGYSVLEAMAAGVPVVATSVEGIPEIGGETMRYVEPGNAESLAGAMRERVLLPLEERAECVERQKERAKKFPWSKCAEALMGALQRAVLGAPQGR